MVTLTPGTHTHLHTNKHTNTHTQTSQQVFFENGFAGKTFKDGCHGCSLKLLEQYETLSAISRHLHNLKNVIKTPIKECYL